MTRATALAAMMATLVLLAYPAAATAQEERGSNALVPFILPWDDSSSGPANISGWLHKPAGKFGHIRVGADGHLYAGDHRIRFFGVNCCFGACFPRKEDAGRIAARMAKFGINCVRFHHMDFRRFPDGIMARDVPHTRNLDPEALDRLDYFIAQLKENGIYANLNILVSRQFNAADGLPADIEKANWVVRREAAFIDGHALDLHKEYAEKLLLHRNSYTGMTYAEDPAVAIVEISNETNFIGSWLAGVTFQYPEPFLEALRIQWNEWLKKKHGTTESLRKAWEVKNEHAGRELLTNGDFSQGMEGWTLESNGGAAAEAVVTTDGPDGAHALRIDVSKPGTAGWHVKLNQRLLSLDTDRSYIVSFQARADAPSRMQLSLRPTDDPWRQLGSAEIRTSADIELTDEWRSYRFIFLVFQGNPDACIEFGELGLRTGTYRLANVSVRPGGEAGLPEGENLEEAAIPLFKPSRLGERAAEARRDWFHFLWDTEDRYWQGMYKYLKETLNVRAPVIGTQVGNSTPNLMAKLDIVDAHQYWQHPHFIGGNWNQDNWIVPNCSMVNERGGTLSWLAEKHVLNKPLTVTEYNHTAPNTYGSEGFLLLAAYGAFQDWDGVFAFSYSHRRDDWDTGYFPNFFDIDQHPTKMAALIPAMAMFTRGDVSPGRKTVVAVFPTELEYIAPRRNDLWALTFPAAEAVPEAATLVHRVAIAIEGQEVPKGALRVKQLKLPRNRFLSDTGELTWDLTKKERGVVTVNSRRSKAVIGYAGGKEFDLGGVVIKPGKTMQDGWCTITVTAMEGFDMRSTNSILITATGYVENTRMGWKNSEKSSVGRDWGERPSLVECVPASIVLPIPAGRVRAWALDERGRHANKMPVRRDADGNARILIGPQWRTLWYAVAVD